MLHHRFSILLLILGVSIILWRCGDSSSSTIENPEEFLSEQLPGTSTSEWTLGGKAFGVFHEVEDFKRWKPVFDRGEPQRNDIGFRFLDILCRVENENDLAIFFGTPDHKSARNFISDDLRERMEEAGVKSVPSFIMYDVVFLTNADYSEFPYRVAISYKVRKFDPWYEKFLAGRDTRKAAGVYDIALGRSPESPRILYMMMAAKSLEEGQAFINSESSVDRLLEYGLTGDPTFSMWKRSEFRTIQ
jgi:hypothetical protein